MQNAQQELERWQRNADRCEVERNEALRYGDQKAAKIWAVGKTKANKQAEVWKRVLLGAK